MVKNITTGFPLGIKINDFDLVNGLTLEKLIELTKTYHNDKYIIGRDTLYVEQAHYHIHFYSAKDTSDGALKVFRTNLKKSYPHLSKSFRLYTGQDLPSADPMIWIAYAMKEKLVKTSGIEITDEMVTEAGVRLGLKKLNKVHSEKKANEQKEKKAFKEKMFDYVLKNVPCHQQVGEEYYGQEEEAVKTTLIQFMVDNEKFGSIKEHFLSQYYLEYKAKYAQEKWTAKDIRRNMKR